MHWEKGYRAHGLWEGDKRLAVVSLSPHAKFRSGFPVQYTCFIDETEEKWVENRLSTAKKKIENKIAMKKIQTEIESRIVNIERPYGTFSILTF